MHIVCVQRFKLQSISIIILIIIIVKTFRETKQAETKLTARVLKEDPNTKGLNRTLILI